LTRAAFENPRFGVTTNADATPCCYQVITSEKNRKVSNITWKVRAIQGKILSILRLAKGLLTFKGGVDYILWKIERHSGISIEVSPTLKRIPPLAVLVIFWRLFRRGAFR